MAPPSVRTVSDNQDKMATPVPTGRHEKRAQPWKNHWPPAKGVEVGVAYGFKKGDVVHIYGN